MIPIDAIVNRRDIGSWLNANGLTGEAAEIGVAYGENAESILSQWDGNMLHLIDPWSAQPTEDYVDDTANINFDAARWYCHGRLSRFKDRCNEIREMSDSALRHFGDNSLDFVYLDGNHAEPQITRDLDGWWEKVKCGGLFGGHDYENVERKGYRCDVKSAVDSFAKRKGVSFHVTDSDALDKSWWILKP